MNPQTQTQNYGPSLGFGSPPWLKQRPAEYVAPHTVFTVVIHSLDPEVVHEVAVVLTDLFRLQPDADDVVSAINVASGETLISIDVELARGFKPIEEALLPLADRHNSAICYTFGPVGLVTPSESVYDDVTQ